MSPFYGSPRDQAQVADDTAGPFQSSPRERPQPDGPVSLRIHHEPHGEPFAGATVYCVGTFTLNGEPIDPGLVSVLVRTPGGDELRGLEVEQTLLGTCRVAIHVKDGGLWLCRLWTERIAAQHDFYVRS